MLRRERSGVDSTEVVRRQGAAVALGHWDDAGFDGGNVDGRGHLAEDVAAGMLLMCCPAFRIGDGSVRGLGGDGCVGGVSDGFD